MSLERRRLTLALLLSLLIHSLLLSLTFGGHGLGFPGFGFLWQDRPIEMPDLRVVLIPAQVTAAEPLHDARVEQPAAGGLALTPSEFSAPPPARTAAAIARAASSSKNTSPRTDAAIGAAPAKAHLRVDRPDDTVPQSIPEPAVIASARSDEATLVVPATPAVPTPAVAPAPTASSPATAMPPPSDVGDAARARIEQEARERDVELAGLDRAKNEAQQQAEQMEAARQEAARLNAERQEAARQEAAQQEAARQEAARQEAARQEAARQEAARQEAARQEAARQEAARQEAARQEAARQEAARQEAARQEAARIETARIEVAQEAAERREARLREIGRQLNEEADRREAASAAARLSPSSSSARRGRLFGRADPNAELILYAEAWERKIQLNMTFDMVREAAKLPHTNPMVTVAIRNDGSVESVTFVLSSGAAAIDEAIRRIVHSQEHYQAFPPGLAREYDVIEIRRTWYFDMAIRLY